MKKIYSIIVFMGLTFHTFGQVGIGTETPNSSTILDVSATDKGMLFPRVSLGDVTSTMLDGTNTAAFGLLIWNTNAATTGGDGIGLYYFDTDSTWKKISTSAGSNEITFKAGNSTNFTFTQGVYSRLDFDTISFNFGGGSYDTATDLYTIPQDGIYEVSVHLNIGFAGTSISEMLLSHRLYVNGVLTTTKIYQGGSTVNTTYGTTFTMKFVEELSNGDEIGIDILPIWNGVSVSPTVFGGANSGGAGTHLYIKKVN